MYMCLTARVSFYVHTVEATHLRCFGAIALVVSHSHLLLKEPNYDNVYVKHV